jgi:ABC-type glycerol-3-phosphate transport system substrate-binding protein
MTFDDFLSYVKAVDDYNKKNSDYIKPFHEASDWTTVFSIAVSLYVSEFNNLEEIFDDKISEKKLQIWHKTLKALEQVSAYNFINEDWKTLAWNDINLSLLNEECLFFANGSWMYNIWLESDPSKVMNCVPNEYPTFRPQPSVLYPATYPVMWGVLKSSPNKDEAIKFLLDMTKPTMAENWVRNTKCPTGIKGNLADASFGSDQYENFASHIKKTYGSSTYKISENSSLIFGSEYSLEKNYFMEVISGELTADEAMAKIHERFNSLGLY